VRIDARSNAISPSEPCEDPCIDPFTRRLRGHTVEAVKALANLQSAKRRHRSQRCATALLQLLRQRRTQFSHRFCTRQLEQLA